MFNLEPKIVLFDVEYTSWEGSWERGWDGPGEYKEIIQMGAVKIETKNFTELDSLILYIKPRKNPILSDYIKNLTGISQDDIDKKGLDFPEAITKLAQWGQGLYFYSWGADGKIMNYNCKLCQIKSPIDSSLYLDIIVVFERQGMAVRNYMSSTILEAFGKKSKRTGHDGLNDARTIADGLKELKNIAKNKKISSN